MDPKKKEADRKKEVGVKKRAAAGAVAQPDLSRDWHGEFLALFDAKDINDLERFVALHVRRKRTRKEQTDKNQDVVVRVCQRSHVACKDDCARASFASARENNQTSRCGRNCRLREEILCVFDNWK
jgi:hypothetical protein